MNRASDILNKPLPPGRPVRLRKKTGGFCNLTPFVFRSNRARANEVVKLRNKLRLQRHMFGGRFIGNPDMLDPERPILYKQEAYAYFAGTDKRVLWNAHIVTARRAFWDELSSRAFDRAWALKPKEPSRKSLRDNFEPIAFNALGQPTTYRMRVREKNYEEFGGISFSEFCQTMEKEILANDPPAVHEFFTVDPGYEYGIGLYAVVEVDMLDRAAVEAVIDRFIAIGETNWRSAVPVPRERLPFATKLEAMAEIPVEKR